MEWTQVSKLKLEFLKIQTDLLYSAIELCQESKTQYWSSKVESKLKETGFIWNEIKKVGQNGYTKNTTSGKDFIISESPDPEITESNLTFLGEKTKNWCEFKAVLFQSGFISTLGKKPCPPDDTATVFNSNLDPMNPKFLDGLKESGNGFLAQLLCSAAKEFVRSEIYETANANFKENEEDLSKLDAKNSIELLGRNNGVLEASPNFLNYVRLPELSQMFSLSVEVKSLMERMADLKLIKNFADYQIANKKLKELPSTDEENEKTEYPENYESIATIDQIHTGPTFLQYSGTLKRTEIFSRNILGPGPLGHPSILTWLHLEHLDIYTPLLFQTLAICSNLRVLRILDVRFIGELNRRVTLPKIESFALATRLTNLEKAEGRNVDRSMLKSLIFFQRDASNSSWKVENISDLNIDIDISINGDRIFKIRHHDGLLYSQLNYTNEILKNIFESKFQLKQLFLRFCEIEITSLPEDLTLLETKDVTFPRGGTLSDVLNQCKALATLGVSYTQSTVFNLLQLSQFGNNLRYLYLFNVHVPYLPVVVKLDTLFMYCCSFAPETIDKFSRIFKARRVLIICKTMEHCNFCSFCSHIKILHEARKSECAEWVSMKKFDRGHRNNHTDKRDYLVENEVEAFLKKSGVTKGSTHFILEKKEGVDGWIGKDVVVDDEGWMEQQGVIQGFEVMEDDKGVLCSNIAGTSRQFVLPGVSS